MARNRKTDPPPTSAPKPKRRKSKPVNQSAHTNSRSQHNAADLARVHPEQRPTIIDTHAEPVPEPPPNGAHTNGANGTTEVLDQVEASLWVTALQGVEPVVNLAATLPPGATRDVLLNTLPEEWRTTRAVELLRRISDGDAAMLLAWVCRQWWDAYGLGHVHHEDGQDWRGAVASG